MPIEKEIPKFELNDSQPASPPLLCFHVGDHDFVAAYSEENAREVLEEMNGEDPGEYADWDVALMDEAMLDKPWCDEDDKTKIVGTLREWLSAATKPMYLCGTE